MSKSSMSVGLGESRGWMLMALIVAGAIFVAGPLVAQNEKDAGAPATAGTEAAAPQKELPAEKTALPGGTEAVRAKFEAKIAQDSTELNFTDTPLTEAMQFLGARHNLPILIEVHKLEEAAVAVDTPINQILSGVSLDSALHILLSPLQLTYIVEDEVVKITTVDRANDTFETRVYDTRSFKGAGFDKCSLSDTIKLLTDSAWKSNDKPDDGEGAAVIAISDGLIIRQTPTVHRQIARIFDQLTKHEASRNGSNPPTKSQASVSTEAK
jgi:hypothetical protein